MLTPTVRSRRRRNRIQRGEVNDPNRTSFELQLNSKQVLWLAGTVSADDQRTRNGRSADARQTLSLGQDRSRYLR